MAGLEGAVYEVRAAEDISTPDGTLRYSKSEVVDTITTSSDGFVKSKELYLGKYEVKEITAPYGMVVSGETHTVELTYAGQNISVTETSTSFYNERQKVQVSLAKAIEKDKTFGIGDNGEIKNISFGLYAAEDIVSASGTVIPADGLIEIVSVNENGTAVMKSDLPFGKYYVKEIATDEHYVLSDTKYPVVFEYAGQDTATVEIKVNDGKEIKNELIYGSVSGKKIDENGEALEGAVIGIFKAEETEFTKDTALMTTTSAKDGSFSFAKVPYGKWIVREIEQPKGFVLDEKAYEVNISKAEQVVEIEIVNEYVHGNIRLTKVDAEYPDNKLTGATFEAVSYTHLNDLATTDRELLVEWDYELNKLKPTEVSKNSAKRAWWQCRYGHSWSMKINERTVLGKGCRMCEQEYMSLFPALAISYYSNLKGLKVELGSDRLFGIPLDVYIPLEQVAIQVNTDSEKIDILKEHLCKQRGIKLIKLPMKPNEAEPEYAQRIKVAFQSVHIFISSDTEEDVKIIRKIFKNWRNSR